MKIDRNAAGNYLYDITQDRDRHGNVYSTTAKSGDPRLGLMVIRATRYGTDHDHVRVEFCVSKQIIEVRIDRCINIWHRATFSRQFNRYIRPQVIEAARDLGLIPTNTHQRKESK